MMNCVLEQMATRLDDEIDCVYATFSVSSLGNVLISYHTV